ncbi:cell division protein SepF [Amycolatopsis carbonis]|uniref:Cell division protein SepF n=1 Tax=Amycolatopsis carbonis TaxID=715471 RepID=A0A9Y2ICZ8_9PSEU|nr:cell division protein SepF [Amycolatopsis sp. 2-15]WIX76716.1 cell division protein SepF [Amycolatopsis sp. 2-15]
MTAVEPERNGDHDAALDVPQHRFTPLSFGDARAIGEAYRKGEAVLIDLTQLSDRIAVRFVDFSAGLGFQAGGQMSRVASKVYLLAHAAAPSPPTPVARSAS